MKLDEDKKLFKQAILATSQALNLREVFVEKDYWIVYALKNPVCSNTKVKLWKQNEIFFNLEAELQG